MLENKDGSLIAPEVLLIMPARATTPVLTTASAAVELRPLATASSVVSQMLFWPALVPEPTTRRILTSP